MKGRRLLINTALLTATSLLLRGLGLAFQVYLTRRLGTEGTGVLSLIMSVNVFAATLAISGIRFATTRLVSEELGRGRGDNIPRVVRRCVIYGAIFGTLASVLVRFLAPPVAALIKDGRMARPIRLLGVSLPFVSAAAALTGYFTGVCRVGKSSVASVTEQLVRMAASVWLLRSVPPGDVEGMCCAVVLGGAAGEIFSFFVIAALYLADSRRYRGNICRQRGLVGRMLSISMPLAVSAYARTALTTIQNILVPEGLRRSGASSGKALSDYGMVQGMAFPVVTFPQVIFSSLSELLVPELTEEQVRGNDGRIARSANALLKLCFLFSAGVMGALLCFARELGAALFDNAQVGIYIKLLAPLMPVMYMDSVTDGMLRGLGEHLYSMRLNIIDSLLSTLLVWFLLPRYAVYGYIFILYASEVFNFAFSMRRLSGITEIRGGAVFFRCALASVAADVFTRLLMNVTGWNALPLGLGVFAALYCALVKLLASDGGAGSLSGLSR